MSNFKPYAYQLQGIRWIEEHPRCCLFWDMGLGKTVVTLTAIQHLLDQCEVSRVLVVAPKKVAETTWLTEADKWAHLALRVSKVAGTPKQRAAALSAEADIYVVGRDSFVWLVDHYHGALPFDACVIDELTSFKGRGSKRFRAMRAMTPTFSRVIGLTGTPAPNGLIDLWAQMYCIDMGERLGKSYGWYQNTYFHPVIWDGIVIRCNIRKGCDKVIERKIKDICLSMQAKDYIELPEIIYHDEPVVLSEKERKAYEEFERNSVMDFVNDHTGEADTVLATSAAALMSKLSQYANGAVYNASKEALPVHEGKTDRLAEIVEALNGESVLVFYLYKSDVPRIVERLKGYKVKVYTDAETLKEWNAGKIDVLLAHPSSTAYGLNMQQGGHYIVWFGTGWNLELYLQANARLHRQGQTKPVHVYRLICSGTVDARMAEALKNKEGAQQALLKGLAYLMGKHGCKKEDKHID